MSTMGFPHREHPFFRSIQPASSAEPTGFTDDDLARVMPRHFPLSIPGDEIPGHPAEHQASE